MSLLLTPAPATPATHRSRTQDEMVWKVLFDRQTALLHRRAVAPFAEGIRALGLERGRLPDISALDRQLFRLSGWHLAPVSGRLTDAEYLELLSRRVLPITERLRAPREFEFVPGPDLFHDAFGHLPLLVSEPRWAQYLEGLGRLAQRRLRNPHALQTLTRLYWHTAEFGLLREKGQVRAIGAGLLSSTGELHFAMGDEAKRQAFSTATALDTDFQRRAYQSAYFVLPDWESLTDVVADAAAALTYAPPVPVLVPVLAATR